MKLTYLYALLICFAGCQTKETYPDIAEAGRNTFSFSSNDTTLTQIFTWAVGNSNKYVGNDSDPVGPWYEAALPEREAFCMRDISHQCLGEELNGHGRQNLNMFTKFVENISVSKDYCTYWEINKDNLPAPVDYESDKDFWYNLNANFDVLNACYRLYLWTGNEKYINDPRFDEFFRLTANEYIGHWQLQPDQIMDRPGVMHEDNTLKNPRFKTFRGLPSYEESVRGLTITGDLIASVYKGLDAYARIWQIRGNEDSCRYYAAKANEYARLYDTVWWNEETQNYYAYKLEDEKLKEGGCNIFPLWFDIVKDPTRIERLLSLMAVKETNVESMSYYPMTFFRYGKSDVAYRYLIELFTHDRRDYPEVASGIIEGIVCGLAGVDADAEANRITTLPRFSATTDWVSVENIPVFSGKISILHQSEKKSSLVNKMDKEVVWRAMLPGKLATINKKVPEYTTDVMGKYYSYMDIPCQPGQTVVAEGKE